MAATGARQVVYARYYLYFWMEVEGSDCQRFAQRGGLDSDVRSAFLR